MKMEIDIWDWYSEKSGKSIKDFNELDTHVCAEIYKYAHDNNCTFVKADNCNIEEEIE